MLRRASLMLFALTVISPTFSSETAAQDAPQPTPTDEQRRDASVRFGRGVELYQEQAFRAALVEFERAYAIAPDYRLLYNIGQVQLQLADYLGATHSYERYLTEGGAQVPTARRVEVENSLKVLNERVGRVQVTCNLEGAEISVDDQAVGVTPLAVPVAVNVGRHRVYARAKSGAVATQMIDVAGGDVLQVSLQLKESAPGAVAGEPEAARPPWSRRKKLAVASWALAGAALAGATVSGVLAKGKIDDRKAELKSELPDQRKLGSLGDSASTLSLTADVLGGVAIAAAVSGVVLWLMDGRAQAAPGERAGRVVWDVGLGTVSAKGSF